MRQLLALLATILLSIATIACGNTSKVTSSASQVSPAGGYLKDDGDKDFDDVSSYHGHPENDDRSILAPYGSRTSPADTSAVTTLVKRYYVAAAAGDGAQACSLLSSSLATGLALGGSTQSTVSECAAPMSQLFKQQHQRLVAQEVATMVVVGVHVKGNTGLAVLGFKKMPESEITVVREDHAWKIDALFESDMS
jgi:hypothetical protein